MVLKVHSSFEDIDFGDLVEKLNVLFNILYVDKVMYLALRDYTKEEEARKLIKKLFKPRTNFLIIELDAKKIMQECQDVMEWCRDAFVALETQRFEEEQQEVIRRTLEDIEKLKIRLRNSDKEWLYYINKGRRKTLG